MKQTLNLRQQLSINLGYCYSSRRATQNMAATRNSPTIGFNLRALPLSAVTVSLHYLPRCLRSVTCGKTPTTVTWSASSKICCHGIVTQQRSIVEQFAPEFRHLPLQAKERTWVNCKLITACYQNSEPDARFTPLADAQVQDSRCFISYELEGRHREVHQQDPLENASHHQAWTQGMQGMHPLHPPTRPKEVGGHKQGAKSVESLLKGAKAHESLRTPVLSDTEKSC